MRLTVVARAVARLGCLGLGLGLLSAVAGCARQEPIAVVGQQARLPALPDTTFARVLREFSEPEQYFDTDNLISNEATYLDVAGALDSLAIRGGAYLGVGPDQNFSYIARVRPAVAFIVDIRRDNQLQLLWYKALFRLSPSRAAYLALLFGKPAGSAGDWTDSPIDRLLAHIESLPAVSAAELDERHRRMADQLVGMGLGLTEADLAAIRRIHSQFLSHGPELRFTTFGRAPRFCYPTYRDLLLARDLAGRPASYLATEADFRSVKGLSDRNRIIPIVGDFAGPHALARIGTYLTEQGLTVSAFYTSNVEFYLMGNGTFPQFVANLEGLPRSRASLIIRAVFNSRFLTSALPRSVESSCSAQSLQRMETLLDDMRADGYRGYGDLVTRRALELR